MRIILAVCLLLVSSQSLSSQSVDDNTTAFVLDIFRNITDDDNSDVNLDPINNNSALPSRFDLSPSLNPTDDKYPCVNENNEKGYCVLYYLCDPDSRSIITDGTTIIDVRERVCPHYMEVCCKENKIAAEESKGPTRQVNNPRPLQDSSSNEFDLTSGHVPPASAVNPHVARLDGTCGWSKPQSIFKPVKNPDKRLYADLGEFPWMVAIIKKQPGVNVWNRDDFLGGGSIIHPSVVITVAHKVNTVENTIKCRAGEWDAQTTNEQYPFQERDVVEKIVHPEYFRTSLYNDVALLILERQFDLSAPHVGVACLGQTLPAHGTTCYSMGWGKEFNEKNKYAVVLKKVKLKLVGADECQSMLRTNSRLGPYFELHRSLTCAGGEERVDVCRGDGGSSLVCPVQSSQGNSRYVVYGMVAYGFACGKKNVPGVYANVPYLYDWVQEQMVAKRFGSLEVV